MTRILFACVENACRSQMAEGFARRYEDEKIEVSSGGSNPADKVNDNAVKVMEEKGIDISSHKPKEITSEMARNSDIVVTMGCGPKACPAPIGGKNIEWQIDDPAGGSIQDFREARDEIENKVLELLKELKEEV